MSMGSSGGHFFTARHRIHHHWSSDRRTVQETVNSVRASAIGGTNAKDDWADLKLCHGAMSACSHSRHVDWIVDEGRSHPQG